MSSKLVAKIERSGFKKNPGDENDFTKQGNGSCGRAWNQA